MESIVSNQSPVSLEANREHDNTHFGWIQPRFLGDLNGKIPLAQASGILPFKSPVGI